MRNEILLYLSHNSIWYHSSFSDFYLHNLIVHYHVTTTESQVAGNNHISEPVSIHLLQSCSSNPPSEPLPAGQWWGNVLIVSWQQSRKLVSYHPTSQMFRWMFPTSLKRFLQLLVTLHIRLHVHYLKTEIQVKFLRLLSFQISKRMLFPVRELALFLLSQMLPISYCTY